MSRYKLSDNSLNSFKNAVFEILSEKWFKKANSPPTVEHGVNSDWQREGCFGHPWGHPSLLWWIFRSETTFLKVYTGLEPLPRAPLASGKNVINAANAII